MTTAAAIVTILGGLLGPAGGVYAPDTAAKAETADWEQGRPLWSLCEPRSRRGAASKPLNGRQGPVAPVAETAPRWSDCEGIGGPQHQAYDVQPQGGGMSRVSDDDDDEPPICDGGTRCSPVPTKRSQAVGGFSLAKAIAPPTCAAFCFAGCRALPPASLGQADDGYPSSLFEPPRAA